MTGYDSPYGSSAVQPRHVFAGILAVVVSVGLHFTMLYLLEDVRFNIGQPETEQANRVARQHRDAVNVRGIDLDAPAVPDLGPDLARPEAGTADQAVERPSAAATAPDAADMAPPAITRDVLAGSDASLEMPEALPEPPAWEPRQEVVAVVAKHVADELALLPRFEIPAIERVTHAPDMVASFDTRGVIAAPRARGDYSPPAPGAGAGQIEDPAPAPVVPTHVPAVVLPTPDGTEEGPAELFPEPVEEVTEYTPMESLLKTRVWQYSSSKEPGVKFLRIEVDRIGADLLPVVPKDVVFVQDCSASMSEERLHFCRKGLIDALTTLGPRDRFNILAFRDASERCFPEWAPVSITTIEQARGFISGMTSEGETDLYASMQDVLALPRDPARPVIVILVTDGRSTTGLTASSRIIGEFTRTNDGAVSVFAMGTRKGANLYLLDLLTYCNRGTSDVAQSGRWSIPDVLEKLIRSTRRPVLANVRFRFDEASRSEVHPEMTSNLYEHRPLVLYARCPETIQTVVFQARGEAGETKCDMIFSLDLSGRVKAGDDSVRDAWAHQRIYDLMGEYARKPTTEVMTEIRRTSRDYRIPLPYQP